MLLQFEKPLVLAGDLGNRRIKIRCSRQVWSIICRPDNILQLQYDRSEGQRKNSVFFQLVRHQAGIKLAQDLCRTSNAAIHQALGLLQFHPDFSWFVSAPGETEAERRLDGWPRYYFCKDLDRKSTRLNSSHANISYAVFC